MILLPMNQTEMLQSVAENLQCTYSRSGGPGGQNVNKVNTRVQGRMPLNLIRGLSEDERERLSERMKNRIDSEGNLLVSVDEERTQQRNRDIAYRRMIDLIRQGASIPKKRIATKASRASKLRRLESKKHHGELKNSRARLTGED